MGELIFALFIGLWMIFVGIFLNVYLTKEEKRVMSTQSNNVTENKNINGRA